MSKKKNKEKKDSSLDEILQEVENLKKEEKNKKNQEGEKSIKKNKEEEKEENLVKKYEEKISQLEEEKKSLEEKFLRVNADIQNIRRRSELEKIKYRHEGAKDVLKPILTAIDNFSRAFETIPENLKDNSFVQGIINVEKSFMESLSELGVEFFGEKGEVFDEKKHESMMLSPDAETGKVAQVFEKGVKFKETILRHAKVSVGQ